MARSWGINLRQNVACSKLQLCNCKLYNAWQDADNEAVKRCVLYDQGAASDWGRRLSVYRFIGVPDKLSACLSFSPSVFVSVWQCVCVWLKRSTAKCWLISGHAACHKSWVLNYSRQLDLARLGPNLTLAFSALTLQVATCCLPLATCHKQPGAIPSMSTRLEAVAASAARQISFLLQVNNCILQWASTVGQACAQWAPIAAVAGGCRGVYLMPDSSHWDGDNH